MRNKLVLILLLSSLSVAVFAVQASAVTQTPVSTQTLNGPVTGHVTRVPDFTCPPNFLGASPQNRITVTGVVHHAAARERIVANICTDCCHPGGYNTTIGSVYLRVGDDFMAGPLVRGGGGWWGYDFVYTITFTSPNLANRVGQQIEITEPFNVNNQYMDTGRIDPGATVSVLPQP